MRNRSLAFLILALAAHSLGSSAIATPTTQASTKKLAGYDTVVVEPFAVEKNAATENFPQGFDALLQGRTITKLREGKVFEQVLDKDQTSATSTATPNTATGTIPNSNAPQDAQKSPEAKDRRLLLASTVILFDKGSRAARYWGGFGAGESKIKVRFIFTDSQTGKEVLRFDQQGTFKGMWSAFGGSTDEAAVKAVNGVVKRLIEEIEKNR
jgi:hypothetical protein